MNTPSPFRLSAPFTPQGDQPAAIAKLNAAFLSGTPYQTLLGVTGSGKTFTMAHCLRELGLPTLVISHNKTLAAQLFAELRDFFPENAVHYFVSYYDYYQPEAYIPQRDIYIEKDAAVNDVLDRLRLAATSSLVSRSDVVIVASVSCIYGLGDPKDYAESHLLLKIGGVLSRRELLEKLISLRYTRNDQVLERGAFRVRGDVIEICPSYEEKALRIELCGDEVERLYLFDPVTGEIGRKPEGYALYPAKHFVVPEAKLKAALGGIERELDERVTLFRSAGKILEAERILARTRYDLEMMREIGYCKGIENYSRHLSGKAPGERPACLLDYFPRPFFTIVDESHVTVPQVNGMYRGDRTRKETLIEHGFRLPSALDNRPLRFEEWETLTPLTLFVSATPAAYEIKQSRGAVVEQVIRPTGLVDPLVHVRPTTGQVADLIREIKARSSRGERVLITTLTKRLAEEVSRHFTEAGISVEYLHSDVDTLDRPAILNKLREGKRDALVGVNLLREGLDLPEVSLVAILDADQEGFLRSHTSLIQTMGRSARHANAEVILYADRLTPSMTKAMEETARRRTLQLEYNRRMGITPQSVKKAIKEDVGAEFRDAEDVVARAAGLDLNGLGRQEEIALLERAMFEAAARLEFEKAAALRDLIKKKRRP